MSGDTVWQKLKREHGEYLIDTLEPLELAYPFLKAGLISQRLHEQIQHQFLYRHQRNHELLIALERNSESRFTDFLEILCSHQHQGVVEKIAPNYARSKQQTTDRQLPKLSTGNNLCEGDQDKVNIFDALLSTGANLEKLKEIFRAFPLGDRLMTNKVLTSAEYKLLFRKDEKTFDQGDTFMWLTTLIDSSKSDDQKQLFILELQKQFSAAFRKRKAGDCAMKRVQTGESANAKLVSSPVQEVSRNESDSGSSLTTLYRPIEEVAHTTSKGNLVEEETHPFAQPQAHGNVVNMSEVQSEGMHVDLQHPPQNEEQLQFQALQSDLIQQHSVLQQKEDQSSTLEDGSHASDSSVAATAIFTVKELAAQQQLSPPVTMEVHQLIGASKASGGELSDDEVDTPHPELAGGENFESAVDNRIADSNKGDDHQSSSSRDDNISVVTDQVSACPEKMACSAESKSDRNCGAKLLDLPGAELSKLVRAISVGISNLTTCERLANNLMENGSAFIVQNCTGVLGDSPDLVTQVIINGWIKSKHAAMEVPYGRTLFDALGNSGCEDIAKNFSKILLSGDY